MLNMLPSCLQLVTDARRTVREISWAQISQQDPESFFLVDVREPHEFAQNYVPGSINVPRGLLEFTIQNHPRLEHLDTAELLNANIYLMCGTGGRSALAARSLETLGFRNVYSIAGGLNDRPRG